MDSSSSTPSPSFVHLHVHSHYSMMRGVSSVETLCRTAAASGYDSLALTDTNGFYGLIRFLEAARKHRIQPIVGVTLQTKTESAVLLAKSPKGYEILSDCTTRRHLDDRFSLAASLPEVGSDVALLSSDPSLLKALRARIDCWVEVIPGSRGRKALALARELDLSPVATNQVYFAHPDDYALHRLARTIDCNATLSTVPPQELVQPDQWLKPPTTMAAHFPNAPEALCNTVRLARSCYTAWDHFRLVFPHYQDQAADHFELLLTKCRKGIGWRYGDTNDAIEARLTEELELIRAKGYVDYFLVVADIVGRRPIHCGRGSGAASLVSYLLGITHVDPIRHRLLFGRFLNPERKDPPDIDVDFPWDERDALSEELLRHYSPERMAAVANHVGFGARAAVREVAKVYGIPAAEIKEMTRRLGSWTDPARIGARIAHHPKFRGVALDPPWPEIFQLASRLESLPRHLSVHCGGIILAPDRVSRHVPVQRSAKGMQIIQWEKDQTETAGLVKIDLLGNRSLAVIRDTLAAVRKNTGKVIDYALFNPLDDPPTQDLIRRGETMGVFYVESPAMRQLQQKTQRGDFEHLVIHSSIIRPAANRYIREYIERLHGKVYKPIHPSLGDILSETYGVLVYQEDVVQVAMALAGFSWGEADGVRKVISKKSSEQLQDYRRRFFEGCARRGVSEDVIRVVWDMFLSFAGYSFCKPHSASYALVSFKSAYLKVHHPAEFMAAVISNGGGYYSTLAYISEARRMGISVLGPDVNASEWHYLGNGSIIRMGWQQLRDIRRETLESLVEERRRKGPFRSLEDFLSRVALQGAEAAMLVKSGALDNLPLERALHRSSRETRALDASLDQPAAIGAGSSRLNRPQRLWLAESWINRRGQAGAGRLPLPFSRLDIAVPPLRDLTPRQTWQQEMEALGLVLSAHPLALYAESVRSLPQRIVKASELLLHVGKRVWLLGWPVTRKEVMTKGGDSMEFVSFEDETAIYETVFFPKEFQRFCQRVDMGRGYLLYGKVESEFGVISVTALQVSELTTSQGRRLAV